MDRRKAIALLAGLPAVASISTVPAHTNEVLVVECDEYVSHESIACIRDAMNQVWPDRKVVVFPKGLRLKLAPSK